jgi:two-component system, NtrC family, nitrogen regulation sensor histidine kinase NtrY
MPPKAKRNPELTRLYLAVGLGVLIWMVFQVYKMLGARVDSATDPTSRWALLALGLFNTVLIGALLYVIARSLAKLYFERRSGILGARLRTKLVVSLLAVCIAPSLMLFLMGRNFISKNIERWFRPETQEDFKDSRRIMDAYQEQLQLRLRTGLERLPVFSSEELPVLRRDSGMDLLARAEPGGQTYSVDVSPRFTTPKLNFPIEDRHYLEEADGTWILEPSPGARAFVGGVFMPRVATDSLARLAKRHGEAVQMRDYREPLASLPQNVFLFLTLLFLFAAVWVGLALSRTISEPVRALARAAQRVGTGDLDVALSEHGEDELALLSRSFNTMTRDLKTGREAIEAQAQRIESQREYLGQLLEALPVGVMSWRENQLLVTFNPAARRWFGVESWAPDGSNWEALAQEPRMGGLPRLVKDVTNLRKSRQEELRIGGEGEGRPVRAMVLPLSDGGVLAVLEDLSLLAQAEKRAAWQEVARRMAHEVKNPLTPIKLTVQRMLRRSGEGRLDPEALKEATETILYEVASLSRLVDSFSRFAKLPVPQPRELDACELLRQVEALYAPAHVNVQMMLELPETTMTVCWDGDMVKRALINLVDNAISAMEGRGQLRLRLRLEGGRVHLDVEDDGSGVPETDRERLFEPYFSTKRKGTGLGLAIVRRIAQDHGGEARYEPLEQGSRFSLELPGSVRTAEG